MTNHQIIDSAIKIVLEEGHLLSPGDTVAHSSDKMTYEFVRYENGNAIVGWDGITKSFPASEVFDPNIVRKVALDLKQNMLLSVLSSTDVNCILV
jgi:hypothetical protein